MKLEKINDLAKTTPVYEVSYRPAGHHAIGYGLKTRVRLDVAVQVKQDERCNHGCTVCNNRYVAKHAAHQPWISLMSNPKEVIQMITPTYAISF